MKRVNLSRALIWIMPELHSIDVQHNNLFIGNIMLHWELGQKPNNDWSVQLGVRIAHG